MRGLIATLLLSCIFSASLAAYIPKYNVSAECSGKMNGFDCDVCERIRYIGYEDTAASAYRFDVTCLKCNKGSPVVKSIERRDGQIIGDTPTMGSDLCFSNLIVGISAVLLGMLGLVCN